MRRARLTAVGLDADLAYEADAPALREPVRDQVVIEVEACGVCHRDLLDRTGRFPFLRTPVTPGHEAVGRVVAVGPTASRWSVGDRVATMHRDHCGRCGPCKSGEVSLCQAAAHVFGLLVDGGYASHLMAPERALYAADPEMSSGAAAVLHCTFGTAWRGLHRLGAPASGSTVLVTGANGGVGSAAVQLASRLGHEVIAVVRDASHGDWLTELGANHVVVAADGRFDKQLGARRADVVLECVGASMFPGAIRAARVGGRVVSIGNIVKERVPINLGRLITYGLVMVGSSGATPTDMAALLALHAEAPLKFPDVEAVPLAAADAAQRRVHAGGLRGRLALVAD